MIKHEYDSLNRLVREDNKQLNATYVWVYDNCGNIVSKKTYAFTLRATELLEELESTDILYAYEHGSDRLLSYNGSVITYDIYGNPVIYRGESLEWQYGKRLKKFGEIEFTYDGYGRRISKGSVVFTYDNAGNLVKQSKDGVPPYYLSMIMRASRGLNFTE